MSVAVDDRQAVQYVRPRLYPKQEAALFDPARYAVVEASTDEFRRRGRGGRRAQACLRRAITVQLRIIKC